MKKRSTKERLIGHLKRGWMTTGDALARLGTYCLAQRVSELISEGHEVKKKWKNVGHGKRVMSYRIVSPTRWTL